MYFLLVYIMYIQLMCIYIYMHDMHVHLRNAIEH